MMVAHIQDMYRLLTACQVALIEFIDEDVGGTQAIDALIRRLDEATKLAKKMKREG